MTPEKLSEIYYINKEIKSLQMELAQLQQQSMYKAITLSDMPKSRKQYDMALEYASAKQELEDLINYSLRKLQYERKKIETFLGTIPDPELRLIMRLRALNNMSWEEIGNEAHMDRRTASRKFYAFFNVPTK